MPGAPIATACSSRIGARADERLTRRRAAGLFDVVVPIGYNDAVAEPYRGSAIFIHAARPDGSGTAGCVAVPRQHLEELARRLEPGMVLSVEPGMYVPGLGGFRHSDTVLITETGMDLLTDYPRDLASLTLPA